MTPTTDVIILVVLTYLYIDDNSFCRDIYADVFYSWLSLSHYLVSLLTIVDYVLALDFVDVDVLNLLLRINKRL